MILIEYSPETQFSAVLTIICLIIAFVMMLSVLKKAIKTKQKILYWFFATIFLLFTIWFVPAIAYVYWLFTKEPIAYEWHMIGYNAFYPFGILAWLVIYTSTLYSEKKKIILSLFLVSVIIFEIYMFYFLFFAPNAPVHEMLGEVNELKTSSAGATLFFGLFYTVITCISGMHFAIHSIEHAFKKTTLWKGRFLIMGFLLMAIQITMETIIAASSIILVLITRILLLFTITMMYFGFILPKWIKKLLSLEEELEEKSDEK